ncbi:MAG: hypothetical protein ACE5G8_02170 [Anaerolineae bacterium]
MPLWSVAALRAGSFNLNWTPVLRGFDPWRDGGLLPYYLAALLPLAPLNAVKAVSAAGVLAASSGVYLWLKSWLGRRGASAGALAYTYAPFTIATLYVRGAWSESFFWGLLPWALLAATFLVSLSAPAQIRSDRRRQGPGWIIAGVAALFWAALGMSHLGLGVWAFLFLGVMLLVFHRPQAGLSLAVAGMGLAAAALATLPRATAAAPADLTAHLLYPSQLMAPFWGYGISRPGWDDGMSFSLGLAPLGLAALAAAVWRGGPDRRPWFFAGMALATALLLLPVSGWVWQLAGLNRLLAYPWQLLGFAALGLAVMAGVGFWLSPPLRQIPNFAAALIIILLAVYPHLEPQFIITPLPAAPEAVYGDNEIALLWHAFTVDNPAEPTGLTPLEPQIPLEDPASLAPGQPFYLRVRWQALRPPEQSYKVFAHLVDDSGQVMTQVDVVPQNGDRPTTTWLPGELIEDQYTFALPPGSPSPAQVWLGLYDGQTLARLPVSGDAEGRAVLDVK